MFIPLQECLFLSYRLIVKNPPANAGDTKDVGSIPGWGRYPGEGNDNPLQYSCLGNVMDRRAWNATVQEVAKCQTRMNDYAPFRFPPEFTFARCHCWISPLEGRKQEFAVLCYSCHLQRGTSCEQHPKSGSHWPSINTCWLGNALTDFRVLHLWGAATF